jgi:(p)ppGpp synthase/HD superfamily hydrolase
VTSAVPLGPRFVEALAYATEVHSGQSRKGTNVPYVSHLLAVCALVLEDGGEEDEAIAALLHDAVEDRGGRPVLEEIRRRFGDRVAGIVRVCSDTVETTKPPWKERKARYVEQVRTAPPDARRVSCADKLHNARSLLRDYRLEGERVWDRFSAPAEEQLWYYRSVVAALRQPGRTRLLDELEDVVGLLEAERSRVLERSDPR